MNIQVVLVSSALFWGGAQLGLGQGASSRVIMPPADVPAGETNHNAGLGHGIVLKPTAIAPAGASGTAKLQSGTLSLHLSRLEPGHYRLEALGPDGFRRTLGALTIVNPTAAPDRRATDNTKEASANPDQVRMDTEVQIQLSAPATISRLRRLMVVDRGGNTLLAGDVP